MSGEDRVIEKPANKAWLSGANALIAAAGVALAFAVPAPLFDVPEWALRASGLTLTIALLAYLEVLRRAATRPVGSDRDIAERQRMISDLERIRFAVDHAGEAIFLIDPDSRFLYVNQSACAMFGYSADVLLTMTVSDIDAAVPPVRFRQLWESIEVSGAPEVLETTGRKADGHTFSTEVTIEVLNWEGEKLAYAFVRDITEQNDAELTRNRFAGFVDQTQDAVVHYEYASPISPDLALDEAVEMNFRAIVTDCNENAAQLYRFDNANAMLGRSFDDFVDRGDPGTLRTMSDFVTNGFELRAYETTYKRSDSSVGWVRLDSKGEMVAGCYIGLWTNARDITAEKSAEEALLRSEHLRAEFLARTQEAVIYYRYEPPLTPELTRTERVARVYQAVVAECNDAAARIYGFESRENMIGLTFGDIVNPKDPAAYKQICAFLDGGYRLDQYESAFRSTTKGRTWVAFDAAGVIEDGVCTGVWVSSRDITDRVKAERDLRLIQIAIDHSSEAISLVNMDGRYVYANEGASRMWGYSKEELLRKRVTDLDPHAPMVQSPDFAEEIRRRGSSLTFESTGRRADGSIFPREATVDIFEFEEEDLYCTIQRDISERKAAEATLYAAGQQLESHVENSPLAVIEWNMNMRVTRWSPQAERLFEWSSADAIGSLVKELSLVHPDERELGNRELDRLFDGKVKSYVARNRKNLTRSGSLRHCEWYVSALTDADGKLVSILALVNDITAEVRDREELDRHRNHLEELVRDRSAELEAAQAELVRKEKLSVLGHLTGTVSHELRNPLGTIKSSLYFIRNAIDGQDSAVERALARAERNISRCDQIIDELLDFTRVQKLKLESIPIDDWLREVVSDFTLPPNVELLTEFGFGREMKFEPDRLRRCVINVLSNACEAMNNKSHTPATRPAVLRISSRPSDGRVEIDFVDTGSGISSEDRARILEPLYSTKGFGVGLGLPIVKQIVEQHNGDLDIVSEVGRGTTVRLSFPIEQ